MSLFHATIVLLPLWNCGNAVLEWNAKVAIWPSKECRTANDQSASVSEITHSQGSRSQPRLTKPANDE
jgi:hypothetical protein